MRFCLLMLMCLVSLPTQAAGNPDPSRKEMTPQLLYLDGPITGRSIAPLSEYLDKQIRSKSVPSQIDMLISSPGGSVIAGFMFLNRMNTLQARGTKFNCYVLDMAASMAFQILTQCDSRVSLPTSFLLWHGVRVGSADVTAKQAISLAQDLKRMDELILLQLEQSLDLSADPSSNRRKILFHFDRETLWTGLSLHASDPSFLDLGTFEDVLSRQDKAIHSAPMSLFDLFGSYVYKWDGGIN